MDLSILVKDPLENLPQNRALLVVNDSSPVSLEDALKIDIELAVLIDGTDEEKERFYETFKGRESSDDGKFIVAPLPYYEGADIVIAYTQGWEFFNPPDTHDGSDADYFAHHKDKQMALQGFGDKAISTVHKHLFGDPKSVRELFWSFHGELWDLVENKLHGLSRDKHVVFDVGKNYELSQDGKLYVPGTPVIWTHSGQPLKIYSNEVHQAGTSRKPSLAALWMGEFMVHDHCKRNERIGEALRRNQFYK